MADDENTPETDDRLERVDEILQAAIKAVGETVSGGTTFRTSAVVVRALEMIAEDAEREELFQFLVAHALYTRTGELVRESGGAPILAAGQA